jgi:transketolase N-terminal domain/subunit
VAELAAICKRMRREVIEMITDAKSGHPGGSLSATEIVVTLYFDVMRHDPGESASGKIATGSFCRKGIAARLSTR